MKMLSPFVLLSNLLLLGAYCSFAALLVYSIWASTRTIELGQDDITVSTFFGFGVPTRLKIKDIRRMLLKLNYINQIVHVVIEFDDGRKVVLSNEQKNFEAARLFLTEHLGHVPCEVK